MSWDEIIAESAKVFSGAVIGTIITAWYKDFKEKKSDRKRMFLRMVESKSYIQIPQSLVNDLNMLPVLYRKEKNVLSKYRLYYADLCLPKEQLDYQRQQALYWDLLREMGNAVGYNNLDNHTLNSRYIPNAAVDEHLSQKEFRDRLLAYLKTGNELQQVLIEAYYNPKQPPLPEQAANQTPDGKS